MKWILLISMIWAGPATKVTSPSEVKIKESYSVASLGLEAEAFRIQAMSLQGKTTYMVSKLINGQLFLEKPMKESQFSQLRQWVQPLLTMPSSEDCKTPMRVTFIKANTTDQLKLCNEKTQVSGPIEKFMNRAKEILAEEK